MMSEKIDFSIATSEQIEAALCGHLESIRLSRNITQSQLARSSGISRTTVHRMEEGEGISLNTFIRVLMALGLQNNLQTLLPDPTVRPVERVNTFGGERKRARPSKKEDDDQLWSWGDETADRK